MPKHRATPLLRTPAASPIRPLAVALILPLVVSVSPAADQSVTPERFNRIRPGVSSFGPAGMPTRRDAAVTPATFHAVAAKPLSVDPGAESPADPSPTLSPPRLDAEASEDTSASLVADVARREPEPLPAAEPTRGEANREETAQAQGATAQPAEPRASQLESQSEPAGRRLRPADAAEQMVDRRRAATPSFPNPLDALSGWRPSTQSTAATVGAALVAIGLLFSFVWLIRCCLPKSARPLPRDVVEVLGRAPLAGKQTTQLIRVGPKLVLVATTPDGAKTLCEITDPAEVARIVASCQSGRGSGSEAEFDSLLQEMSLDRSTNGFLEDDAAYQPHDQRDGPRGFADGGFDPRSLAAAYANTPGGRGDG